MALLIGLVLVAPAPLAAHQYLVGSTPAREAELDEAPTQVRLVFSERAQLAFTTVELVHSDGTPVRLSELRAHPDSPTVVLADIEGQMRTGAYTIAWRTVGADGHATRGSLGFVVMVGAEPTGEDGEGGEQVGQATLVPAHHDPATFPAGDIFHAGSLGYVAIRWLLFAGLMAVIGAASFRLLVLPLAGRYQRASQEPLLESAGRGAARLGVIGAAVVLVAAVARLFAQSVAVSGRDAALDPAALGLILTGTVWGSAWVLQVVAAGVALLGFVMARRGTPPGWTLAGIAVLALAVTPALSGHAVGTPERAAVAVASDSLHVLAAGGWLGGLLALIVVGVPAAVRLGPERRGSAVAALVNGFSPTALVFAGMVIATGVYAAWLHVGGLDALMTTGYGRTLLLKVGILTLLFATGAYNFLRVRPALGADDATGRLRRSSTLELAVAVAVLLGTAVLVATPTPRDAGPGAAADSNGPTAGEVVRHDH